MTQHAPTDRETRDLALWFYADEDENPPGLSEWLADRVRIMLALAWDEGHRHCFHVEDPRDEDERGNPISHENPWRVESPVSSETD